jgi:hypothetical protein
MILLDTLLVLWSFTLLFIVVGWHFKMYVFGIAGGFLLLLSGFLLFEPIAISVGTVEQFTPMNITFDNVNNVTTHGAYNVTKLSLYEEFTTPYFDIFGLFMQLVCIFGGMYVIAESSFKQYNLK